MLNIKLIVVCLWIMLEINNLVKKDFFVFDLLKILLFCFIKWFKFKYIGIVIFNGFLMVKLC